MFGEIIAIGDELISGKVLNTTSTFAAKQFFSAGYPVSRITAVGDDPENIEDCLLAAIKRSGFVIITGGLGPTEDDITNEVVSRVLGRPLVVNQAIMDRLESPECHCGLSSPRFKRKLAMLPQGAEFLNPRGHAAGYLLVHEKVPLFFLPGVPKQLEDHMINQVIPRLSQMLDHGLTIRQRTFKVFGLQETEVNEMLESLEADAKGFSIGYYPNFPEVHITVTLKGEHGPDVNQAFFGMCEKVEALLGDYVIALDDETLEDVLGRLLTERGSMLALAESCTGGLIGHRVTRVPGSSHWFEHGVVTYSNRSKEYLLGVPAATIRRHGAVSRPTAIAMAQGVRERSGVDFGLAVTGIAGPEGGTPDKPVGTVYIALSTPEKTVAERFFFPGRRHMVQDLAAETALDWLRRYLRYDSYVPGYRTAR